MKVKCECNWEYNVNAGDENWEECPNCDLPYKHIRKSKWISVEDRLPGDYEKVLAINCGEIIIAHHNYHKRWWYSSHEYTEANTVTHWQPLPDPLEVNDE